MKSHVLIWAAGGAVLLFIIIASGLLSLHEVCRDFKEAKLTINQQTYKVAVANSDIERHRGLAGCTEIPKKSGMYFTYDSLQDARYWMKGMVIPIDIVWISQGKVVGIESNVQPVDDLEVNPPQYAPPTKVNGVLEVGAGKAHEYGIEVGSMVVLES